MKTSRPVDARLWAAREDPGLQSELGAEYTRPTGGCHEHAARFCRHLTTGEGPGLTLTQNVSRDVRVRHRHEAAGTGGIKKKVNENSSFVPLH